jgi:NTE family protein
MPYADLVLEGGGVKGIGLVGAISVLEEHGYEFKRVAGTSAGAIVGALVAAGVPGERLVQIMRQVDYRKFQDGSILDRLLVGKALSLLTEQGIYEGKYARSWVADQLAEERGVRTFADLAYQDDERPLPPDEQFRLVVMASDLSQGCLRRLPWEYNRYGKDAAQESVADAVRASMSIPFFYEPVQWDTADGEKAWLVDGGMLSNFPIDVFDAPSNREPRWPTIGIKLSAKPTAPQGIRHDIDGPVSMGLAMVKTMTGFYDRMHVEGTDATERTIFVDTGKVKATDFELSPQDQAMLYVNGREAAEAFLDTWDFEAYKERHRA